MTIKAWTYWYDEVLPEVPGVLQAMAKNAIKQAAIDFFNRSLAYVVDQGPMSISANANTFDWDPPQYTEVVRPLFVWVNKKPITPKSRSELTEMYGDFMQAKGAPAFYVQDIPDQFILVPAPTSTVVGGLTAKIAVSPTQEATGVEDVYYRTYYDAIASGAKARLMRIPKKPYTDKDMAAYYTGQFEGAINAAMLQTTRGGVGARMRTKPQFM